MVPVASLRQDHRIAFADNASTVQSAVAFEHGRGISILEDRRSGPSARLSRGR
jgi:hypothetical protein